MEQHLKGKKHISISNQILMRKRMEMEIASEGIYVTGTYVYLLFVSGKLTHLNLTFILLLNLFLLQ